jgi:putative BNR repeat neuraminidase
MALESKGNIHAGDIKGQRARKFVTVEPARPQEDTRAMRCAVGALLVLSGLSAFRATDGAEAGAGGPAVAVGDGFARCLFRPPDLPATFPRDWTSGPVTRFNDNGAWTWYTDERAVVDAKGGKLLIGSDANAAGSGGASRDGLVEVVIHDLATGTGQRTALGALRPDDHDTPGFLVRPDGKYLAFWAGHNQDTKTYFRIHDGAGWTAARSFDWTSRGMSATAGKKVTYNNLFYLSSEKKVYDFVRSIDTSPNVLVSTDDGETWAYGGRLTSTPTVGYVAGYYKYWGNGIDRIDFVGTEAHPRDFDNSLYHGYLKGGKTYDSAGKLLDGDLADGASPDIRAFTRLFATGTTIHGLKLHHAWNIDLQGYQDGSVALLWKARAGSDAQDPDHRMLYARFDGASWRSTYLCKAGRKLYGSEQDYIGLGALHPNDPRLVFISTPIDPRDDATVLGHHEIFQGTTPDDGASFAWMPITMNSSRDNLRPILPAWDGKNMALLWFRGTYRTAQSYDAEVVGIIARNP